MPQTSLALDLAYALDAAVFEDLTVLGLGEGAAAQGQHDRAAAFDRERLITNTK